jgi:hypothetical protein
MPVTSITAMGTEMIRRMSAGSVAAAQTAATVQVNVPKTRIASKDEAPAPATRASAKAPAAAVTPTKSKTPLIAGGVALAAVSIAAVVWQLNGKPADSPSTTNPATQSTPTPDSSTSSTANNGNPGANSAPTDNEVDTELKRLNGQVESTDPSINELAITGVQALAGRLDTPERRVRAAVIEAMAQSVVDSTKRCIPLRRAEPDVAKASLSTAQEYRTLRIGCPDPQ